MIEIVTVRIGFDCGENLISKIKINNDLMKEVPEITDIVQKHVEDIVCELCAKFGVELDCTIVKDRNPTTGEDTQ